MFSSIGFRCIVIKFLSLETGFEAIKVDKSKLAPCSALKFNLSLVTRNFLDEVCDDAYIVDTSLLDLLSLLLLLK